MPTSLNHFKKVKKNFHKRNRIRDPRVPEPKRSPLAIFNAACPFSSEFLVKVTFVSTRPGILRSRRILNHAKPSITPGGMKIFLLQSELTVGGILCQTQGILSHHINPYL
jgi:hypothetical protein